MVWLSDCEKMKMFSRFDRVHERDGRTERQTLHDGIGMSRTLPLYSCDSVRRCLVRPGF